MQKIREFILKSGSLIVDIAFVICCIAVIITAISSAAASYGFFSSIVSFLGVLIGGIVLVFVSFYYIYLLSDIAKNIKEINEKTK